MANNSINDVLVLLREEFLAALPERINEIERLVLTLVDKREVEDLLRAVHSLKGTAGTYGFHVYTKICHQMEDTITALIDSQKIYTQHAVNALLNYNDLLNIALELIANNDDNFSSVDAKLLQIDAATAGPQRKALIVEPSPLYASMLSASFSDDYLVKIASDGLCALESLLMQNYDVVLTAMEVPTLNGEAILSALRLSNGKNRNIKAILVTTKDRDSINAADLFNHIVDRNIIKDGSLLRLLD